MTKTSSISISDAIQYGFPSEMGKWTCGDTYESIDWKSDLPKPTLQEIETLYQDFCDKKEKEISRLKALSQRWPDAFSLLDDILENGLESVKQERNSIKSLHQK